jgi:hypothetical protein
MTGAQIVAAGLLLLHPLLAGFGLHEFPDDRDPLGLGEARHGRSLRLDPEPGAMLSLRG